MDSVCKLITRTFSNDDYGIQRETEVEKTVFCDVSSISASEFFDASQTGLKPDLRFILYFKEYSGEGLVKYKGEYFSVYRTYLRNRDYIELYTQRDVGT